MKLYNKIFLLRHLRTQNNDLHIISGQSDSQIICNNYLEVDFSRFDKIYCSPSPRCVRTLEILGKQPIMINSIIYDKRLLERNMGSLEGVIKKEGISKYPELFKKGTFNVFKTPPEGESYEYFKERVEDFYDENLCLNEGLNVLICSHNQTLKLLRLLILKRDITYLSWAEYSFSNGQIVEIKKN